MTSIAILGFGVVGGGVAELIEKNQAEVARAVGDGVRVKHILDIRDFSGSPYGPLVTGDVNKILDDPEVNVLCETMGGVEPAFSYTKAALERGKSVCTSNKELVDARGPELTAIAREHGCSYLFEASVGGGIPILRTLRDSCRQNRITHIEGILNGTCNYILTKMDREGVDFSDALKEAQEKGFAERNPDADVLGHDTGRKIAILASLVSGKRVAYSPDWCEGITGLTRKDLRDARERGQRIKLLGFCDLEGGEISIGVAPRLVEQNNPLYGVSGVFNGILLRGNMTGDLMFYGKGAGKLPTASAVVSDVLECLKNVGRHIDTGLTGL